MKTYLVTGGAGFIGSNFVMYMLGKYDDVNIINVDKLTYAGNLENLKSVENNPRYSFVQADICDREAISKIFTENDIDYIIKAVTETVTFLRSISPVWEALSSGKQKHLI